MEFEGAFFNTEDYELTEKKLGEGNYGKVYQIKNIHDHEIYAVKILKTKGGFNGTLQMKLMRESMILHKLDHKCIVKFKGINFQSFKNSKKLKPSIITEFVSNGSLRDILQNERRGLSPKKWNATKKYNILLGISSALKYMHAKKIIHRDLKPENILMDDDFCPKISDFGLSRILPDSIKINDDISLTGGIGTPLYMSPELLKGDTHYDKSVDVYAFSIIAYEIVTGKLPYYELGNISSFKLSNKVIDGYRPKFTKNVTEKMKKLLNRCWSEDSTLRPTFDEIYSKLSSDFSYIDEDVDESEISDFIEIIKSETDETNEEEEKISINKELNEELFRGLDGMLGNKNERNLVLSSTFLKLASDKGSSIASYILGLLHGNGECVQKDFAKCKYYYKKSFKQGNTFGLFRLGYCFYKGYDTEKNYSKSFKYYSKSSSRGNGRSMDNLGTLYEDGKGVEKNISEAIKLYKKANELGSPVSLQNLSNCYKEGIGVEKDYDKSFEYVQKFVETGHPHAFFFLGRCYQEGIGVEKDISKAIENYKKSGYLGYAHALIVLSDMYLHGKDVSVDKDKAARYYKMAADNGNVCNKCIYADKLYFGKEISVNKVEAARYYKMAADNGNIKAMSNYANMLERGDGIAVNKVEAVRYYKMAADNGNKAAMNKYTKMLKKGDGITIEKDEAAHYKKTTDKRIKPTKK